MSQAPAPKRSRSQASIVPAALMLATLRSVAAFSLCAAPTMMVAPLAHAQEAPSTAPTTPPNTEGTPTAADAPGPAPVDAAAPTATDPGAVEAEPAGEPLVAGDDGGLGDICKIDPTACPTLDLNKEAAREVKAKLYAVQQVYALRKRRTELEPYFAITMNDQYASHPGAGLRLNYYITNVLAIGANATAYHGMNSVSDFNFQTGKAARVSQRVTEYSWNANANFTYVPAYGKFAGGGDFIFHYDFFLHGGVGAISTRPVAFVDPANRTFDWKPGVSFNVGLGLRIFFNRWLALTTSITDYIFFDQLEAPTIAVKRSDPDTWYEKRRSLTNNVQAEVGLSIFVPFKWQYRLPK